MNLSTLLAEVTDKAYEIHIFPYGIPDGRIGIAITLERGRCTFGHVANDLETALREALKEAKRRIESRPMFFRGRPGVDFDPLGDYCDQD